MITIKSILAEVEDYFGCPNGAILGRNTQTVYAEPRKVAHWLAHKCTGYSYSQIGMSMKRHHTTILSAVRSIETEIDGHTELGQDAIYLHGRLAVNYRMGDWLQTYTGKAFFPMDPKPEDIDIIDIAHGLSNLCRYSGQTRHFYSVAQHSVLLAQCAPEELKLHALLHDAAEAYLVDIPRPIKPHLPKYREIENRVGHVIAELFKLGGKTPAEIKVLDDRIVADEMAQLFGKPGKAFVVPNMPEPLGVKIDPWSPGKAKAEFLREFGRLTCEPFMEAAE